MKNEDFVKRTPSPFGEWLLRKIVMSHFADREELAVAVGKTIDGLERVIYNTRNELAAASPRALGGEYRPQKGIFILMGRNLSVPVDEVIKGVENQDVTALEKYQIRPTPGMLDALRVSLTPTGLRSVETVEDSKKFLFKLLKDGMSAPERLTWLRRYYLRYESGTLALPRPYSGISRLRPPSEEAVECLLAEIFTLDVGGILVLTRVLEQNEKANAFRLFIMQGGMLPRIEGSP